MPVISRYSCNQCDFEFPSGWGGYTYAVDDSGRRVVCPHPGEMHTIRKVTGLGYAEARKVGRVGFAEYCVCLECVEQFDLDLERDARICPECASCEVCSLRESVGKQCPRCKTGVIEEGSPVRWKLDPDWEQLPVPQIVKDLVGCLEYQGVPSSLEAVVRIANSYGSRSFFVLATRLLNWWEGEYFSEDQEQKDSVEMNPQWTWCEALPTVLEASPALAELIVIRESGCWFAAEVTPDMRRGIKNYIRQHRTHEVMA